MTPIGQKAKVLSKTPIVQKTKVSFEFGEKDLNPHFTFELVPHVVGSPEIADKHDDDKLGPLELLELVKTDDFCLKVSRSLKDIYFAKIESYKKLEEITYESIKNDQYEKDQMKYSIDIKDLDKMFPMIITNTVFLTKVRTLRKLAEENYRKFYPETRKNIDLVKENLTKAIMDEEDGIVSITGESRAKIREQLCNQLFILSKGYRPFMNSFLNIVFTGPAGVGKTKLAKTYGFVFQKSGILLRGEVIMTSPKDMVGEYVGQTAMKSAGVLMKGLESVIFVDEAYQIMPCDNGIISKDIKSFGPEAITEIVNFLDKYMGLSIMIVAGYQREMDGCFFSANEGLRRRFPTHIDIPKYSNNDLLNIFLNGVNKKLDKNIFNEDIASYIYTLIVKISDENENIFINQAGDMMNLASMFLYSYYGSIKYDWSDKAEDFANNLLIITRAFNQFLRNKGYTLKVNSSN